MSESVPDILIARDPVPPEVLAALVARFFEDMVKYVADGCIEYTSLINIRPTQGNRGMEIRDEAVRQKVRALTHRLLGRGEPLP